MKTYPWLRLRRKTDIELPLQPPIWLGNRSNGEYFHEQTPRERAMRRMILERAEEGARRLGVDRRQFLASSAGMATTLAVFNFFGCGTAKNQGGADSGSGGSSGGGRTYNLMVTGTFNSGSTTLTHIAKLTMVVN